MEKKALFSFMLASLVFFMTACAQEPVRKDGGICGMPEPIKDPGKYNQLSPEESRVILGEGTEWAHSGMYNDNKEDGTYLCRQCNLPLFRSEDKFDSGSGWPSFDDAISGAVRELPQGDGRYEIECANCGGHLGHVFRGEGFTEKQTRHCVNSVSLQFIPENQANEPVEEQSSAGVEPIDAHIRGRGYDGLSKAVFAGGCFWCTEASFDLIEGVQAVISGYSGGEEAYPTYQQVSSGKTGHAEAVIIFYDSTRVSYQQLLDVFFVAHDPTQLNRQGPDRGPQYRSAIFYLNAEQKRLAEEAIAVLNAGQLFSDPVVTELSPYREFWVAEGYHQNYYQTNPNNPYILQVSRPKVRKVAKTFTELLKKE